MISDSAPMVGAHRHKEMFIPALSMKKISLYPVAIVALSIASLGQQGGGSTATIACNSLSGQVAVSDGAAATAFGFSAGESAAKAQQSITGLKCASCDEGCRPAYIWRDPLNSSDWDQPAVLLPGTTPPVWYSAINLDGDDVVQLACSICDSAP